MIHEPSIDILAEKVGSKYALCVVASKRARQILDAYKNQNKEIPADNKPRPDAERTKEIPVHAPIEAIMTPSPKPTDPFVRRETRRNSTPYRMPAIISQRAVLFSRRFVTNAAISMTRRKMTGSFFFQRSRTVHGIRITRRPASSSHMSAPFPWLCSGCKARGLPPERSECFVYPVVCPSNFCCNDIGSRNL